MISPPRPLAELLERQLRHRYRALDRAITAGVGPAESKLQLGGRPSIAWHARHVGEAIESTHRAVFGAVFGDAPKHVAVDVGGGSGSQAQSPAGEDPMVEPWPHRWEDLQGAVLRAAKGLTDRLAKAADEELMLAPRVPILPAFQSSLATRQSFLEGHIYHVTYHVGSIAVLRAEWKLD